MIGRYRVTLAAKQLDEIDKDLLILDVAYSPMERTSKRQPAANLDGFEIFSEQDVRRTVTITFELHIYDTAKRNEVCQKINAWAAAGGNLRVNDRADQFLKVAVEQFADINSVKNWTDPLTIVFTSTSIPYWQSVTAKSLTLTGKNAKGTLKMDGNTKEALVTVNATAEASVTSLQITVGDTMLKLTGLSVATGQTIVIDYVKSRYLRIRANGKSVMAKMSADSSDNLRAKCGESVAVALVSNNRVSAVISARGLWI